MSKDKKEKVIIDSIYTEDGYSILRVYTNCHNKYPPENCGNGGYFQYDIPEEYLEEWEIVEDYR